MKHQLSEDECCLGHMNPEDPGQCRWCENCKQWVRPKDFDGHCEADEPSLTW